MIIDDGKGNGYSAEVDNENLLRTGAITETEVAYRSDFDASAFGIGTPLLTLTTTGGRVLYLKNTSDTQSFYLTDVWFSWNGGTASGNKVMYGQMFFGDTQPTTNATASGAGVLNRNSSNTAPLDVYYWDEVGDGMTGHVVGTPAFFWCNSQGLLRVNTQGAIILGINKTISFNLQGQEAGEASISMFGFFK